MSYTMTHLLVANAFANKRRIENKALFLLGGMSPDAVHSRADFTFDLKGEAHQLQREEKWGRTYTKEAMDIWYGRVREFYRERIMKAKSGQARDFLLGYTLHLLVDIFNCSLLYAPNLIRYELKVDEMRDDYRRECILQDNYLYQNDPATPEIMRLVHEATENELTEEVLRETGLLEYISPANVAATLKFQCDGYTQATKAELTGLSMVSVESTKQFLETVVEECERILYTFPEVEDTFTVGGRSQTK